MLITTKNITRLLFVFPLGVRGYDIYVDESGDVVHNFTVFHKTSSRGNQSSISIFIHFNAVALCYMFSS